MAGKCKTQACRDRQARKAAKRGGSSSSSWPARERFGRRTERTTYGGDKWACSWSSWNLKYGHGVGGGATVCTSLKRAQEQLRARLRKSDSVVRYDSRGCRPCSREEIEFERYEND